MIKEGLEKLDQLIREGVRLSKLHETSREIAYDKSGSVLVYEKPVSPRNSTVDTLASLRQAVQVWGAARPVVWVSFDKVVAVLDDDFESYRDDRVTMSLKPSPFFGVIEGAKDEMEQKEFIEVLRHSLAGADIDPPQLLNVVRQLRFYTSDETTTKITGSSASIGKSALAEVTGEAELPERFSVTFNAYPSLVDEVDSEVSIACSLFLSAEDQTLRIAPLPGEMDKAKCDARNKLIDAMGVNCTVLVGSP